MPEALRLDAHHGPLAVGAFARDGLGAGAHGHDRHLHAQHQADLRPLQHAAQKAGIVHQRRTARDRGALFQKIGEKKAQVGAFGLQAVAQVEEQILAAGRVQGRVHVAQGFQETGSCACP
jgi:hypothetical protein